MNDLPMLICGRGAADGQASSEIGHIFNHLRTNLSMLLSELRSLNAESDSRVVLLGPFLARSVLEVACTAIVGRLDPFRLLTIRRMQLSNGYDRTMPWKCAIRWQGDVIATKQKEMWLPSLDPKDLSRALFSDYYDELIWQPCLQLLSDEVPFVTESRWLSELLAMNIESFSPKKRETMNSLYSELSKSVHFESVTPSAAISDRISVVQLVNRLIREVGEISLLAHICSHSVAQLPVANAIAIFSSLEEVEVMQ